MEYGFQVEMEEGQGCAKRKAWKWVHPTNGAPYRYSTEAEARRNMEMCYPDQVRGIGTPQFGVRVKAFGP